ncbi:MAG TPA: NifU family protein [Acidimicrobiales bacterium]|nr:NifU family protein [Acidimicrobiales bacterium]
MTTTSTAVLSVKDEALAMVREALDQEPDKDALALVVEVRGVTATGFDYDLYFQPVAELPEGASVDDASGLTIAVPAPSVDRLRGATLDLEDGGLILVNPNTPSLAERNPGVPPELLERGIDGELAQRVVAVLETSVNPAIASHGGRADLVAMDDDKLVAYLALSGGCQGCAMSRATLANGIEVQLREEIPELTGVVDVTDHASGATPYYAR